MRVAVYGLGEIGRLVVKALMLRDVEVVGAVDIDESLTGRDVGDVSGIGRIDSSIYPSLGELLSNVDKPDVVVHAAGSFLDRVVDQLLEIVEAGSHVASTCETLAYPWYRYPDEAARIDEAARRRHVTVIGTGVNPGFVLDSLPALMSMASFRLERLVATRSLDAGRRRSKFREKLGIGLTVDEYKERAAHLTGHVGYAESALLLAQMIGIGVGKMEEGQHPLSEDGMITGVSGYARIEDGEGVERIRVELSAGLGLKDLDEIVLEGEPEIRLSSNGIHGDYATAAVVANIIPRLPSLGPGIRTMADVVRGGYWWS